MKNTLRLHEAMAVVLLGCDKRTADFNLIAERIAARSLFPNRKGGIALAEQVRLRALFCNGRYHHLFKQVGENKIKLT